MDRTGAMRRPVRAQAGVPEVVSGYDSTFIQLYQTYHTRVFAFIYSRVGDIDIAKDLTADVFERAYVKGHTVKEAAAYGSWLFRIARNVVVGHFRQRKRALRSTERLKDRLSLAGPPLDPEEQVVRDEQISRLMAHVRTLSLREQEILALKFDAELTYGEIARVMGMSEVNVRVTIFRAIKKLKERMQETPDGHIRGPGSRSHREVPAREQAPLSQPASLPLLPAGKTLPLMRQAA